MSSGSTHKHCCVPQCINDARSTPGIHFHKLPKDKLLRKAWIIKIGRDPGPFFKVCTYIYILHRPYYICASMK